MNLFYLREVHCPDEHVKRLDEVLPARLLEQLGLFQGVLSGISGYCSPDYSIPTDYGIYTTVSPTLTDPLPLTRMWHSVSLSICFTLMPRGPRMRPMKLHLRSHFL